MKIPVKASIFIICIILMIFIIMAITSTSTRTGEAENALAAAIEQSLKQLKGEESYSIEDHEEWLADFSRDLLTHISSDSEIKVEVLASDPEKGILDILVTERYKTVNGKEKEITCRKTVLFEEYNNEKKYDTICFIAGGTMFKQYSLYRGESILDPGVPEVEGWTFSHWKLEDSEEPADLSSMTAEGDMVFRAVFQ